MFRQNSWIYSLGEQNILPWAYASKVERPKFKDKRPVLLKEAKDWCLRSWHGRGSRGRTREIELEEPILRSQVQGTSLEEPRSRQKVRHCFDLSGLCVWLWFLNFSLSFIYFESFCLGLLFDFSICFDLVGLSSLNWKDGTDNGSRQEIWGKAELKEDASSMWRLALGGCELEAEMLQIEGLEALSVPFLQLKLERATKSKQSEKSDGKL